MLWITVDSMRTGPSEVDDRGVIPFFEKFKANAVCFSNCYCSAPSTVMSVSSMMTAVPAVYHSTCYDTLIKTALDLRACLSGSSQSVIRPNPSSSFLKAGST